MLFSEWLKVELPQLEHESSAVTFKYIKQAKKSTAKLRMLISFFSVIMYVLIGYITGYLFAKFTDINSDLTLAISIGFTIWIFTRLEDKLKSNIIKKELLEIAEKMPNKPIKQD